MSSNPLIRGSTKECFVHFGSLFPKGDRSGMNPLAEFAGVQTDSVYRWVHGKTLPDGLILMRVRYFFEKEGYQVTELESMMPVVRDFGLLVGYNVITVVEGAERVALHPKSLLRVLIGANGTHPRTQEKMRAVYAECKDALDAKMREWDSHNVGKFPHATTTNGTHPEPVAETVHSLQSIEDHSLILNALGDHISALIPLARRVLSDDYCAADRRHLREIAEVFTASNMLNNASKLLNRLCSETARGMEPVQWQGKKDKSSKRRAAARR